MPTALRIGSFRFFFFSNERGEPAHIHVSSQDKIAKFWLDGIPLADNKGFADHEINQLKRHITVYHTRLHAKWREHFDH